MKTILVLFKPAIELVLVALPGLLLLAMGVLWWMRRRSRGNPASEKDGDHSPGASPP